jgi:hypothetical protein
MKILGLASSIPVLDLGLFDGCVLPFFLFVFVFVRVARCVLRSTQSNYRQTASRPLPAL